MRRVYKRYNYSALPAELTAADVQEYVSPQRAPSIESDVLVPSLQALLTGIMAGLAVAVVGDTAGWWAFGRAVGPALAVCTVVAWLWRLRSAESTLWKTDAMVADDHQAPSAPPAPQQEPEPHPVIVGARGAQQALRDDLEQKWRDDLRSFVEAAAGPGGTSIRRFEKQLGRERYCQYRDLLLRSGWAKWRNGRDPRGGWTLTSDAETITAGLFGVGTAAGYLASDRIAARQARQMPALRVI